MELRVKRDFDGAHYLQNYTGPCSNIHGHTWTVEVYIEVNTDLDITIDFKDVKDLIDEVLPDHQYLNEIYPFNPTAENLVQHFYYELKERLPTVSRVVLWESKSSGVEYAGI